MQRKEGYREKEQRIENRERRGDGEKKKKKREREKEKERKKKRIVGEYSRVNSAFTVERGEESIKKEI